MIPIEDLPEWLRGAGDQKNPGTDLLLTDRESAAILRVGVSTFRRYVARGLVPKPLKLGGAARWPRSEILGVIATAKGQRNAS